VALTTAARNVLALVLILVTVVLGLGLSVVLALALTALGGQTGPLCADPPALTTQVPQLLILGIAGASFVSGGLSSRWPRGFHPEHPAMTATLERRRVRLVMRLTFVLVFLLLTALMLIESYTLYLRVWPITYYVRCSNQASPTLSVLGAATYSFLAGRWLWIWR
jgi:hypothetical protein